MNKPMQTKMTVGRVYKPTPSPNPNQPAVSNIRSIQNSIPEFKGKSEGPAPSQLQTIAAGGRQGDATPYAQRNLEIMQSLKRAFSKTQGGTPNTLPNRMPDMKPMPQAGQPVKKMPFRPGGTPMKPAQKMPFRKVTSLPRPEMM
jgi:hypothetical protein